MDIRTMHNTFRTLGQQMGLQTVRAILPESIDVYLNDAIAAKIRQELAIGVQVHMQSTNSYNVSAMNSINAFRTLYKNVRYAIDTTDVGDNKKIDFYNPKNGYYIINIPTTKTDVEIDDDEYKIAPMMYLDFSVEYSDTERGNAVSCRLVGQDIIDITLRDYCNGASKEYPIVCLKASPMILDKQEMFDVIANQQIELYTNSKNCDIKYLSIRYIKVPNIVRNDPDIDKCVHCDLPEYLHYDIVEDAVKRFIQSIHINMPQFQYPQFQYPRQNQQSAE